jgi:hypothetical protein
MNRHFKAIALGVVGCSAGLLAGSGCNPKAASQCYDEVDYVEPEPGTLAPDIPYCGQFFGIGPEPPDGHGIGAAWEIDQ